LLVRWTERLQAHLKFLYRTLCTYLYVHTYDWNPFVFFLSILMYKTMYILQSFWSLPTFVNIQHWFNTKQNTFYLPIRTVYGQHFSYLVTYKFNSNNWIGLWYWLCKSGRVMKSPPGLPDGLFSNPKNLNLGKF
jgi:hypothetical protein